MYTSPVIVLVRYVERKFLPETRSRRIEVSHGEMNSLHLGCRVIALNIKHFGGEIELITKLCAHSEIANCKRTHRFYLPIVFIVFLEIRFQIISMIQFSNFLR